MSSRAQILMTGLAIAALAVGCGGREAAWETTTAAKTTPAAAGAADAGEEIRTAALSAWDQRADEAQLRAAISAWEKAVAADPSDHESWTQLSRALYFLADGHIRFHSDEAHEEQMLATYEKSVTAAEKALIAMSEPFAKRMRDGDDIQEAVEVLDAGAVPALYWRSSALGKWASAKGFATLLSHKDEIKAIMQHCLDAAPTFFYQGPDRYFGVFYARAPGFAGGDPVKSQKHFEASLKAHPDYLGTRVLMAQDLAVKIQNREMFETQLKYVLEADVNVIPEIAAENGVEQKKAKALLAQAEEFFE